MKLPRLRWPLGGEGERSHSVEGIAIPYTLARRARTTIGLKIDHRGLTVAAPHWATLGAIEEVLARKARWIADKLEAWKAAAPQRSAGLSDWIRAGQLPYLGRTLRVDLEAAGESRASGTHPPALRIRISVLDAQGPSPCLRLRYTGAIPDEAALCEVLRRWIDRQARAYLGGRIALYAGQMQLHPSRWQLSSAQTRWGSCSAQGVVRLSARLMHCPPEVIDYVVVHELAHLRELNHSARFWAVVEAVLPDYRQRRALLRHHARGKPSDQPSDPPSDRPTHQPSDPPPGRPFHRPSHPPSHAEEN